MNNFHPQASSILHENDARTIILIDIPRSLEESQLLPSSSSFIIGNNPTTRRIISSPPPLKPFLTPDPKHNHVSSLSPASQIADLMTAAAVSDALDQLQQVYKGPWHLPRIFSSPTTTAAADNHHKTSDLAQQPPSVHGSVDLRPSGPQVSATPFGGYYIPEGTNHLHSSIQDTTRIFTETAPEFDLVVLDPPWPNRSARRKTTADRYNTVCNLEDMRHLLQAIPVPGKLAQNGLVAIWITNKFSIRELLLASLGGIFALWGLELAAEWTWVKVTAGGDPLYDVDSTWRKPWEKLLVAKRIGAPTPPGLGDRYIVAVPDLHSRKPSLRPLFRDILGESHTGLEVFARNLTAGWWSWGNEVLKFQAPEYWSVDHCEE